MSISRRQFLTGMGAAGAVAAGSTLVGCTPKQPDPTPEPTPEPAAQSNVYQDISAKLNPQDFDYRSATKGLSHVLSPWKLGGLQFSNRIVKAASGAMYHRGGWAQMVEYYRRLAAGGTEMVWVENFNHIFQPYTHFALPNIDDIDPEEVKQLTAAIHAEGAKCGTQSDFMASRFYSELNTRYDHDTRAITVEDIDFMVESYRYACKKFKEWGFDAFEINCAGNNVPQWFFSRSRNNRDDEYGAQTWENRVRFIKRAVDAIHEECGDDFPVQILMDAINENDGVIGDNSKFNTIEDNIEIGKRLAEVGVASLHLRLGPQEKHATQFLGDLYFDTRGCIGSTGFGSQFDFTRHFQGALVANHSGCGIMLNISKKFKDAGIPIPIGTVTYVDPAHAPDMFDDAVANGALDFLVMNRPLNVDPEYVNKLKAGKLDEIRPCTRCCHCWNDTVKGQPFTTAGFGGSSYACRLDPIRDFVGQDKGMVGGFDPNPGDGDKNVMVVGAGPAGMEAARIAAERGYKVKLYDKKGEVGGLLHFAAMVKGPHQNLEDYVTWSEGDLKRKGVEIVLNKEVDAAFIKSENPDVVILATGAKRPAITAKATEGTKVISIDDFLAKEAELGDNITVLGSNLQASDTVVYLMEQGKKIQMITDDPADMLAKGQSIWAKTFTIPMIYARGVKLWAQGELVSVGNGEITIKAATGANLTVPCDTIIDARDGEPNKDMLSQLGGIEAYAVGDCDEFYNIQYAIRAGNFCARKI